MVRLTLRPKPRGTPKMTRRCAGVLFLSFMLSCGSVAAATETVVPKGDAKAKALVQQMSDFLAKKKDVSFQSEHLVDYMGHGEQKVLHGRVGSTTIHRPDKMVARYEGDHKSFSLWYDGKTVTLLDETNAFYATHKARKNIDETLDFLSVELGIAIPLADILAKSPYKSFITEDTVGRTLGMAKVGGTSCHHLAFEHPSVDFQLWIEEGDRPILHRVVVTHKAQRGWPQHIITLSEWAFPEKTPKEAFEASLPDGARQIEFAGVGAMVGRRKRTRLRTRLRRRTPPRTRLQASATRRTRGPSETPRRRSEVPTQRPTRNQTTRMGTSEPARHL